MVSSLGRTTMCFQVLLHEIGCQGMQRDCSAHAACAGLAGDCCPTIDGAMLDCCGAFGTTAGFHEWPSEELPPVFHDQMDTGGPHSLMAEQADFHQQAMLQHTMQQQQQYEQAVRQQQEMQQQQPQELQQRKLELQAHRRRFEEQAQETAERQRMLFREYAQQIRQRRLTQQTQEQAQRQAQQQVEHEVQQHMQQMQQQHLQQLAAQQQALMQGAHMYNAPAPMPVQEAPVQQAYDAPAAVPVKETPVQEELVDDMLSEYQAQALEQDEVAEQAPEVQTMPADDVPVQEFSAQGDLEQEVSAQNEETVVLEDLGLLRRNEAAL